MRYDRIAITALFALLLCVGSVAAQKKAAPKKSTPKKPPAETKIVPPLEVRAAREKVDIQFSNVTTFVEVMGPIVQAIEDLDEAARAKKLPKATVDSNEETKRKLIEAIRNLRAGLASLESEFRTKASLKKYLVSIEGITDLAALSEDTAIAGKYVASKDPLRDAAKRLRDTLAVMPA